MTRPQKYPDIYARFPEYEPLLAKGARRTRDETRRFSAIKKEIAVALRDRRRQEREEERRADQSAIDANAMPPERPPEMDPLEDRSPVPLDGEPNADSPDGSTGDAAVDGAQSQREVPPISLDSMEKRRELFRGFVGGACAMLDKGLKAGGEPLPDDALKGMIIEGWTVYAEAAGWLQGDIDKRMALFAATGATVAAYGPGYYRLISRARSKAKTTEGRIG